MSVSSSGGATGVGIWTDGLTVGHNYSGAQLIAEDGTGTPIVTNGGPNFSTPALSEAILNGTTTVPKGRFFSIPVGATFSCLGIGCIVEKSGANMPNNVVRRLLGDADGAVTIAAGTGAGRAPKVSVTSATDLDGIISVTTGPSPTASATIATVTFGGSFPTGPICQVQAANAAAMGSGADSAHVPFASVTNARFSINSGSLALTSSTSYAWSYHCEE